MKAKVVLIVILAMLATGCGKETTNTSAGQSSMPKVIPTMIYIDSVPAGAEVYAVSDDEQKQDNLLGKTPLKVRPDQCPSMKFAIIMDMDSYIEKVNTIKEMSDWVTKFVVLRHAISGTVRPLEYFPFETSISRVAQEMSGSIASMGPIMELDWPEKNRLCIWFIPRHVNPESFFPLMPASGTFKIKKTEFARALVENGLNEHEAKQAVDCISRCGKYYLEKESQDNPEKMNIFSLTSQKEPIGDMIIFEQAEGNRIEGF